MENTNKKLKNLWILSGVPASGKSTWAKSINNAVVISRDEIRFNLVGENEKYFKQEKKVYSSFIIQIQLALFDPKVETVIVDATHINDASRGKLWKDIEGYVGENVSVWLIVFDVPFQLCRERNALREGRLRVPDAAMKDMNKRFQKDTKLFNNYVVLNQNYVKTKIVMGGDVLYDEN